MFNLKIAKDMAYASELAYTCYSTDEKFQINYANPALKIVLIRNLADDYNILAWRGSQNVRDWLANINVRLINHELFDGKVHNGFALDAERAVSWLEEIEPVLRAGRPLYLTGHSKGGAVATLARNILIKKFQIVPNALYTFGSPRCHNSVFPDYAEHYRVVDADDMIPHIPTGFGYSHCGTQITLRNGQYTIGSSWLSSTFDFFKRFSTEGIILASAQSLLEHDIRRYRSAIDGIN